MKLSCATLLYLSAVLAPSKFTATAEPLPGAGETCYNYDDLIPLDSTKPCTGRTVFLSIRDRWMTTRKAEEHPKKCPGMTLSDEIMAVAGTTTTDLAHETFDRLCEKNMELYNSVPPPVCYDYTELLNLGEKECNGRTLFLHIRDLFREQSKAPGAEKCFGGLDSELKALTRTIDVDEAHRKLQSLCDDALNVASMEAADSDWKPLQENPTGPIDLELFFEGAGFLNEETGNFQQEESDFLKRGGYDRYNYIGDDPQYNDHYPTSEQSYAAGKSIYEFHENELKFTFLKSPTSDFEEGSCALSNALTCCWHRDRQYFDNNGNCNSADCSRQNPGDNTDLCWVEKGTEGEIFPYPGDATEGDLHCHGLAWAQNDLVDYDINARAKHNNLFFVSLYDHLYQRGYVDSITDDPNIAGYQPLCGCLEDMNPVARADCTEAVGRANYTSYQDGPGGPLVVKHVPDTFYLEFRACQGYDYVEGFTKEDYADVETRSTVLDNSNNDLSAFIFRQYLEGKIDEDHVNVVKDTLIGYEDPSVNDGDEEREAACKAAFEAKFPGMEWKERAINDVETVA